MSHAVAIIMAATVLQSSYFALIFTIFNQFYIGYIIHIAMLSNN